GLDLSVGMLSEARRLTGASLIQADMRSLPVRSSTMAAIWCCAALLHLPKREAPTAISEFQRVLRPGGLLFLGVQQGIHDAPRYSQSVVRHFADYLPHEMEDHLRRVGLTLVDQSTTVTGSVSWLQTVARKAA
ncbi:MAG: class I SAM-dependent methyltransferase, partial [Actinomycetota bacterium]